MTVGFRRSQPRLAALPHLGAASTRAGAGIRHAPDVDQQTWTWCSPPGWPSPPPGWTPPQGWQPEPDWPPAPTDWAFWVPAGVDPLADAAGGRHAADPSPLDRIEGPARGALVMETWFVQIAFLLPGVVAAVALLASQLAGASISRFPVIVHGHPLENLFLGLLTYLPVASMVPLALLLLARTGQGPAVLGLGRPRWRTDWLPGAGLALGGFACVFGFAIVLAPVLTSHKSLLVQVPAGAVPKYYVAFAIAMAAITAISEEALVSGYLLTRLEQFGWTPRRALLLSLALRTSYHVYYGLGFLLTVPVGYLLTRSFQKHRRLNRPIVAHFLYDAVLLSIAVLWST